MDLYLRCAEETSRLLTKQYSTSFSSASSLFSDDIKADIYNIYALVRLADEIVDSYSGEGARQILDDLEKEVFAAIKREYSANLAVMAFQKTANAYAIDRELIMPFFASMRVDLQKNRLNAQQLNDYIYGSAEVVGLMCLKVFVAGNMATYNKLKPGARALGAAYQKVNFLRDMASDYDQLGRYYFSFGSFETFDESTKIKIIKNIEHDFEIAAKTIPRLPDNSRRAVLVSYQYFTLLLDKLRDTPAEIIKKRRVRVSNARKLFVIGPAIIASKVGLR